MDRGSWWDPVQGVTESHTGVSRHTRTQVSHLGTQTDKKFAIFNKVFLYQEKGEKSEGVM